MNSKFVPLFLLLLFLPSCDKDKREELVALIDRSTSLQEKVHEAQETKMRIESAIRLQNKQASKNQAELSELQQKTIPVNLYLEKLEEAETHYERAIEIWRKTHRKSLAGLEVGFLTRAEGTRIDNVEIEIRDEEIDILSNGHPMTIKISDLSGANKRRLVHESSISPSYP